MTQENYKNAPITEAVIEIKFSASIEQAAIDKVSERLAKEYPHDQKIRTVKFQVSQDDGEVPSAAVEQSALGHRRASVDMTELLILTASSFVLSQLAPYQGWDAFHRRFTRDWKKWKRVIGFREISRIGVRYINRIDIPVSGPTVEFEDYLNIYAKIPEVFGPVDGYAVQAVLPVQNINCQIRLNSAVVPSPILNHMSILFDQDISQDANPPQNDAEIRGFLNKIRVKKNEVFEACITERARQLFRDLG